MDGISSSLWPQLTLHFVFYCSVVTLWPEPSKPLASRLPRKCLASNSQLRKSLASRLPSSLASRNLTDSSPEPLPWERSENSKKAYEFFYDQSLTIGFILLVLAYPDWLTDPQASLPETGPGDRHWIQTGSQIPESGSASSPRSRWSLPSFPVWGHQSLCHPCQESDHHVQRPSVGKTHQRRQILKWSSKHQTSKL